MPLVALTPLRIFFIGIFPLEKQSAVPRIPDAAAFYFVPFLQSIRLTPARFEVFIFMPQESGEIAREDFLSSVVRIATQERSAKSSRLAAGMKSFFLLTPIELIGQLLDLYRRKDHTIEKELCHMVQQAFKGSGSKSLLDTSIHGINRISAFYPNVTGMFLNELLFILPQKKDNEKAAIMEILSSCVPVPDSFTELRARGLLGMLRHQVEEIQIFSLLTLSNLIKHNCMSVSDVEFVLPTVVGVFPKHASTRCRKTFYSVLIECLAVPGLRESAMATLISSSLLSGMNDSDADVAKSVSLFVSEELLSRNLLDRMEALST